MSDELLIEDDDRVRSVVFNRPHRLNAVTHGSYRALATALNDAAADDGVHVVLLSGAGDGFCSGADLTDLATSDMREVRAAFQELMAALIAFPKPLVAAVHGVAVGFGLTVLLHCDLVVVAEDARLRTPFPQLGTVPEASSSWLLPRRIGLQRATDLLLTGRFISGVEAVEMGLAARCHPAAEVREQARALAHELAELPLAALVESKRLIRHGWADEVDAALQRELESAETLHRELGPMRREPPR